DAPALQRPRDEEVIQVPVLANSDKSDQFAVHFGDMVAKGGRDEPADGIRVVIHEETALGRRLELPGDEFDRQFAQKPRRRIDVGGLHGADGEIYSSSLCVRTSQMPTPPNPMATVPRNAQNQANP